MALGYGRLERFDEAVAAMRKAVELDPEDWRLREAFGDLLVGVGRQSEGEIEREAAASLRSGPP
jgi:Flp pilus assembly protein TadD